MRSYVITRDSEVYPSTLYKLPLPASQKLLDKYDLLLVRMMLRDLSISMRRSSPEHVLASAEDA
jgi:hypothetical protein